jgi:DNA-binding NarL/FixJ family response regulator
MLNIILADDHAVVRKGLKSLLTIMENVSVCAEAATGEDLTRVARETRANLLILDLGMPGVAGVQTIADLKAIIPGMNILVLTANMEPRTVRNVMQAGASGYLTKDGDPEEIEAAISAIQRGGTYLARGIRFAMEGADHDGQPTHTREIVSPIALTHREKQVLGLIAQGRTARDMASRLGISPLTVRKHRENLMTKLNLHSTAELTAYAVRLGYPGG